MSIVLQKKSSESEKQENSTNKESNENALPPMISEADFDKISNSSYIALTECLEKLSTTPSIEIVDKIHTIFLSNDSQNSSKVLSLLPRLLVFLSNEELYDGILLILCDISHLNSKSSGVLLDNNVFDLLDFKRNVSFSFVFSICDENKEAWGVFTSKYDILKFDNENIKRLAAQYKE